MRSIPRGAAAALEFLRFTGGSDRGLRALSDPEWREALAFTDRTQLTLLLLRYGGAPEWVRERLERSARNNAARLERLEAALSEATAAFRAAGIEFVVLKGFTQRAEYFPDPRLRVQYDLDLFAPGDSSLDARDALLALGYEPLREMEDFPTDHLPVMIRKTVWQWRGDYFDPDIPVSIDVHFRLWDEETEGFGAPGIAEFWERRTETGFHPADNLGYAALHLLRHLLRGSVRPSHAYELAWFLNARAEDAEFWSRWRELHPAALRRLEAVAFLLVVEWFGCRTSPEVAAEIAALPEDINEWFRRYSTAPLAGLFHPSKDELWLHLSLITSAAARRRVLRRRLFPLRLPGPVEAVFVPPERMTLALRLRKRLKYAGHVVTRAAHHARVLPGTLWRGALWWSRGPGFPMFLASAFLFNLGVFIFVILYNLYLLDRGFGEDFLGLVTGAATVGTIAGALPAAAIGRRFGLRRAIAGCFISVSTISAARALIAGEAGLIASAFLWGAALSVWSVSLAPAVARLTTEQRRPRAFSVFFASGIATGILGGLLAGRLPAYTGGKQGALLAGCALAALAGIPAARLRFAPAPAEARRVFPRGGFITRFVAAIAVWSLAVGSFNPFFNAYFSKHAGASTASIGTIFAFAQLVQVAAILAAPAVFTRIGLVRGISTMQLATAVSMAALAAVAGPAAALVYAGYMAFQWMSEPGIYSLLMSRVKPEEQSGASALNVLVMFSAQAIAALAAGAALARFGYPKTLIAAALIAALASVLFRLLLGESPRRSRADSDRE